MSGVLAAIVTARAYGVDAAVAGASKVLSRWNIYIDRYRGYIPAGVVAARIYVETGAGGSPTAGPVGAGRETGLLQLWLCRRRDVAGNCVADCGYTEAQAKNPELNLKCMLPIWRGAIERVERKFPALFPRRVGYEYWACMQLATMIGVGAFSALLTAAGASPGSEYTAVRRYVEDTGEDLESLSDYFGSQSAAVVARRVVVAERMTVVAAKLSPLESGDSLAWVAVGLGLAWVAHKKGWI